LDNELKTLIVAEKPSVATDLARALGGLKKNGDFYENDQYIISSAVGHLVELFMPDDIDKKLKAWRISLLPILPEKFELKPIEKTKKKFQEVKKLMKRKDVGKIINACDAGREGELIFTYLYEAAKCKKPVERLWMVSMTKEGILSAFKDLRANEEMVPLQEAARSRSEADWLIGINGTRVLTTRMYGARGRNVATVGRVQTPTLAMVIEREKEIESFQPQTYWKITAQFGVEAGAYEGTYQKPDFKKSEDAPHDRPDRIWDQEAADRVLAEVHEAGLATVEEEKKRSRQSAPRLYDLTTLQREANNRFGLPAGKTLRIAQALYERHKMITYPRTDSRALPQDYPASVEQVLGGLVGEVGGYAKQVLDNNWVVPGNKKIFNNAQVSDHFAIIPTDAKPKKLTADEAKVYDMILRRFVAVFYPAAEYDVTTRLSKAGEHTFKTEGKVLAKQGWLEVYGQKNVGQDNLAPLSPGDGNPPEAKLVSAEMEEDATRPPPRYTEATLLSAMEGAGKLVEDDELAEAMKEKGLGTPATRAAIIDQLIYQKYLEREGRELIPTPKAEDLVNFIEAVHAHQLTSPSMTGDWEYKLKEVEHGKLSRQDFMKGIVDMTKDLVDRTKNFDEKDEDLPDSPFVSPTDGKPMKESLRSFRAQDGNLTIYKTMSNRRLHHDEIMELLKEGKVGPLDNFRSKAGKPFSAVLKLEEGRVSMDFGNGDGNGGDNGLDDLDLSQFEVVGVAPDGGKVYATPQAYVSEKRKEGDPKAFRMSRTLLGKTVPEHQVKKLLTEKKTDLIEGFRSRKTNRLFSAFLILKDNGGIGFEFPPRAPKKKGAAKKMAAAKKESK
jgi:DNA topoisomerase-3